MTRDPNRRVLTILLGVVVTMGALAWAAVPFYNWFCRTTGYGGTVAVAAGPAGKVLDQDILIRFDANTDPAMPWQFRPMQTQMRLKIGETGMAFYEAYNPTDRIIAGTAAFNVAPDSAGGYFTKIDCFCFTMQVLKPHERVEMPVTFYVDPAIKDDADGRFVPAITLSYTFYETDLPEEELTQLVNDGVSGQDNTN